MATRGQGVGPVSPVTEVPVPVPVAAGLVADPAPLGLAAFGVTTMMLSAINAGWIDTSATFAVLAMALPFGGVVQLLAGMWAFRRGNTFAATAFSSYGAFWISYFLLVNVFLAPVVRAGGPGVAGQIVGLYLFGWALFTAYMFIASLAGARAVQVVIGLLALTFFALCIGEWAGSSTWTHIGGYLGIATAAAALYASFADVTNASFGRRMLPT
ncbi:MAG TPA: acetate uptake transporter [Candidatus Dormibacteraeota bacterium]|nr:acetate uptake transporter [Candidatus Dormibacteraeota bacterium]